jgi:NAD(P)-dependent dehydrogenase (short-subunit alcohol dehydrogenase family)
MTLELGGRKVVVTGEQRELARTSAESVSHQGADVVIWIREWKGDVNELKQLLAKNRVAGCVTSTQWNIPTYLALASVTMGTHKSYW